VREAVGDHSISDDKIFAVLQCCDCNIDQTVSALLEGQLLHSYRIVSVLKMQA